MRFCWLLPFAVGLTSCASDKVDLSALASGQAAYAVVSAAGPAGSNAATDYQIGPLDKLDIVVFQEPELSAKEIQVDASGNIALPLVGTVLARGKTAFQLSKELQTLFDARYLRNSQVTVTVASSVSQKVSVQGEVEQPGVYPLSGPTTLLDVISMAKGETDIAKLKQVVVFRNIGGQRMGAVFDVASIRQGSAADPIIVGNDLVVVGASAAKKVWRGVVSASPLLNIFRPVVP